ncbi:MAG: hypothetical protein M3Q63_04065 [bacterium]|nr:hypothetical protein [bacterium]
MSEIEFDIEEDTIDMRSKAYLSRTIFGRKRKPAIIAVLKKAHLAKTDAQAYYIILGISIVLFLITLTLIGYSIFQSTQDKPIPKNLPPWFKEALQSK